MGELTKPQIALLMDIANGERPISETYAPAKKLVAIGYAEWIERRWSADLRITPAGQAALAQEQSHER